ncbi:MAG: hypothetical protein D6797_09740 [Bdellovibrio sp.]|nr:MAG: hypothetical protein D6797_09740 [Bdellovibrio sp.]
MNLSEKEKSPRFLLEKFKAFGKEWSAGILHYVFFDLPSVIAEESARYGNTVSALTAPASRFSYEFNGAVLFMDHLKEWSPQWKSHIRFELLKNLVAPEKFNRGGRAVLGTTWTRSHLGLHPYIEIFFSESDVAPASYNSASLGHNNRQGVKYGLDLQFPKRGFGLNFAYVDSRLINRSLSQKDLSSFYFGLETLYVVF